MRINAHNSTETIAAVCTGVGGAISIIRVSGENAFPVFQKLFSHAKSALQSPRTLTLGHLLDSEGHVCGEEILGVAMPNPRSYTGEDVFELQIHGGMMNTQHALQCVLTHPEVRQAEPGEYTLRAFINGKMDLTQAEAVADLIHAQSEMARLSAERQLSGSLREKIYGLRQIYVGLLAECESQLDFPEDVPDAVSYDDLALSAQNAFAQLQAIYATRKEGKVFREGVRIAIAGHPNAGKSSLLNLILGYDRAIVSDIPGTTRDTLEELAHIRGIPVRITDTAGIRETHDPIEKLGVQRSENEIQQAQIVFWILDPTALNVAGEIADYKARSVSIPSEIPVIALWNKCDLATPPEVNFDVIAISVKSQEGLESLFDRFETAVWENKHTETPEIAVNARHAEQLACACELAEPISEIFNKASMGAGLELAATYLHGVIDALGNITGETVDPDVLDHIFSNFCIGK